MKKPFNIIHNEKGLVLPSVLFLTTFVLLYFTNQLLTYNHDLKLTQNIIEQVKAQTLFQMSYAQFIESYHPNVTTTIEYDYPDGKATIHFAGTEEYPFIHFSLQTNNDFHYSVTKSLAVSPDLHTFKHLGYTSLDD